MAELASTAPLGHILDVWESALLEKDREHNRQILEETGQRRIGTIEKKRFAKEMRLQQAAGESGLVVAQCGEMFGSVEISSSLVGRPMPV